MKDGLLEKIRSVGHWRVNFRPVRPLDVELNFQQCAELVSNHRVSIRGWDYPHISNRRDNEGGHDRGRNYYESWCDWWNQAEFWRMYKSAQFISYNAIEGDVSNVNPLGGSRFLDLVDTVYTITEHVEFAHRLYGNLNCTDGIRLSISLRNTLGRHLVAGRGRIPFYEDKTSGSPDIEIEKLISMRDLVERHEAIAIDILLELFDYFGWNPDRSQVENDQARFYRREFR